MKKVMNVRACVHIRMIRDLVRISCGQECNHLARMMMNLQYRMSASIHEVLHTELCSNTVFTHRYLLCRTVI